jgi:hypothetical protein
VGWLLQVGLAAGGLAVLVPPYSLPITLFGIGAVVIAVGWPIRQAVRGTSTRRLDPFRSMRVLLLAKASTLAGSLLGGVALGLGLYLLSRPVLPPVPSLIAVGVTFVSAVALVVCGLLVEHWCRIPPEDDEDASAPAGLQGE